MGEGYGGRSLYWISPPPGHLRGESGVGHQIFQDDTLSMMMSGQYDTLCHYNQKIIEKPKGMGRATYLSLPVGH